MRNLCYGAKIRIIFLPAKFSAEKYTKRQKFTLQRYALSEIDLLF